MWVAGVEGLADRLCAREKGLKSRSHEPPGAGSVVEKRLIKPSGFVVRIVV